MKIQKKHKRIAAAKEMSRGVFWIVEDELIAFPFYEGETVGVAKSGNTYNHQKLWEVIKPAHSNKPFDYYPRGRVDFNGQNKPILYMNPNISEEWIPEIKLKFGLREDPVVHLDHSEHYKCHLDDGYKSQAKRTR